jgi:hypothetical protein
MAYMDAYYRPTGTPILPDGRQQRQGEGARGHCSEPTGSPTTSPERRWRCRTTARRPCTTRPSSSTTAFATPLSTSLAGAGSLLRHELRGQDGKPGRQHLRFRQGTDTSNTGAPGSTPGPPIYLGCRSGQLLMANYEIRPVIIPESRRPFFVLRRGRGSYVHRWLLQVRRR